ncbi:F-box/lrr-repeat protein 16 [Plakobranchus ocellatus]|uniref:F-box/lrr-repeat protein 16 n=1 Tax=Plakobranchus ocellatus TaxID=259542 RepID=A0AAV4D201_9GAST|nr:F-box/lrr-repeat protein 16 [Plakobranchus ocellatus]
MNSQLVCDLTSLIAIICEAGFVQVWNVGFCRGQLEQACLAIRLQLAGPTTSVHIISSDPAALTPSTSHKLSTCTPALFSTMSTIRKAYMEISNGIRGLRFHRDSPSSSSSDSSNNNSTNSNGAVGNLPNSSGNVKPNSADEGSKTSASLPSVRTSKSVVHSEESAVAHAMSRLFPNKYSHSSSSSASSSPSPSRTNLSRNYDSRTSSSTTSTSQSSSSSTHSSPSSLNSTVKLSTSTSQQTSFSSSLSSQSSNDSSITSKVASNGDASLCQNGRPSPVPSSVRRMSKENVFTQTKLVGSPKAGIASRIRKLNLSMTGQKWGAKPETMSELMNDESFIQKFFFYFSADERRFLCMVCRKWRTILYDSVYWTGATPVIDFKVWSGDPGKRKLCFDHFQQRGFDQVCFISAVDRDISDFVSSTPGARRTLRAVCIRCSNITDSALENLIRKAPSISRLELSNCNEVTGSGLWACLNPKIQSLTITDCIHIADDTIGAIAQLLPHLHELNLQAYHVTDNGLALFDSKLNSSIRILRLTSCWEVTNHGVVNIIHSLPNVTVLSLSGCSKVTDDGIEIIAENMKRLKSLDISWCSRVTDASLEYVACDLGSLDELILDRCTHVTDIGIGYISTMTSLTRLFIRWCVQVGDFGLHHIFSMRNLRILSIAGCRRLTSNGLYGLRHLQRLHELEVTNCPGANSAVCRYLKDNMPNTLLLE